jgi:acetyl-CoA carboxylase biotin carboxyl carrier protein
MSRLEVKTEVTGTVWKIEKQVGDAVAEGDEILIFESMKMEIPALAPAAGTITEILVKEGMPVEEGDVVAIMEG